MLRVICLLLFLVNVFVALPLGDEKEIDMDELRDYGGGGNVGGPANGGAWYGGQGPAQDQGGWEDAPQGGGYGGGYGGAPQGGGYGGGYGSNVVGVLPVPPVVPTQEVYKYVLKRVDANGNIVKEEDIASDDPYHNKHIVMVKNQPKGPWENNNGYQQNGGYGGVGNGGVGNGKAKAYKG